MDGGSGGRLISGVGGGFVATPGPAAEGAAAGVGIVELDCTNADDLQDV